MVAVDCSIGNLEWSAPASLHAARQCAAGGFQHDAKLTQSVSAANAVIQRMLARILFMEMLLLVETEVMSLEGVSVCQKVYSFMAYSLTIGTPCFGGEVSWLYAVSLLKLQKDFTQRGWHMNYLVQAGDALVTRARQTIVCHFLDNPSATHLLFIDADIGFEPEQVLRLLDSARMLPRRSIL